MGDLQNDLAQIVVKTKLVHTLRTNLKVDDQATAESYKRGQEHLKAQQLDLSAAAKANIDAHINSGRVLEKLAQGKVTLNKILEKANDLDEAHVEALEKLKKEEQETKDYMNQNVMVGNIISIITKLVKRDF